MQGLLGFLNFFYYTAIKNNFFNSLIKFTFSKIIFIKLWYITLMKFFIWSLRFSWVLFKIWKLSLIQKLKILHYFTKNFSIKLYKKIKYNFLITPRATPFKELTTLTTFQADFNTLILFFLSFLNADIKNLAKKKIWISLYS